MTQSGENTAILFFSRTTALESVEKRLMESSANHSLIHALRQRTLHEIKKTGLSYYEFNEYNQIGEHFGERISTAFQELFLKGYQHIIAIGNDCPEIRASDLLSAQAELKSGSIVLGPDDRGGAYLIGVSKAKFDFDAFQKLAWQTGKLMCSFESYLESHEVDSPTYLDPKYDLNKSADIRNQVNVSGVLRKILRAVKQTIRFQEVFFSLKKDIHTVTHHLRGPPASASC